MNLLERNNHQPEQKDSVSKKGMFRSLKKQSNLLTTILLGIIVFLLLLIFLLLFMNSRKEQTEVMDNNAKLQQSITDYAFEQKQNDNLVKRPETGAIIVDSSEIAVEKETENTEAETQTEETVLVADASDKTAIVVDEEDENDVSYTKEFILNEMLPYFADNNLDAVWDLAHLKRYVKLSASLENTDNYYYMGGVDDNGLPHGNGLAIYEKNSYYYGAWEHGVRSGDGRWYRFYIDPIGKPTTQKKYQAHSYSGQWANDLPNGEGAEHYDVDITKLAVRERILQNVVGHFTNGLYDGDMYANTVDYTGNVEEWNGTVHNGVFDLWRDVSAIGECSVWQKRDDNTIYMDIDEKDNKNQGIRELLKVDSK